MTEHFADGNQNVTPFGHSPKALSALVLRDNVCRRLKVVLKGLPVLGAKPMMHKAKDLSPDQKVGIENLLGRTVADSDVISIRTVVSASARDWLQGSWESAGRLGVDRLSIEEIDAEIVAERKSRRDRGNS